MSCHQQLQPSTVPVPAAVPEPSVTLDRTAVPEPSTVLIQAAVPEPSVPSPTVSILDLCRAAFATLTKQNKMNVVDGAFDDRHEGLRVYYSRDLAKWSDQELCQFFEACITIEIGVAMAQNVISERVETRQQVEDQVGRDFMESIDYYLAEQAPSKLNEYRERLKQLSHADKVRAANEIIAPYRGVIEQYSFTDLGRKTDAELIAFHEGCIEMITGTAVAQTSLLGKTPTRDEIRDRVGQILLDTLESMRDKDQEQALERALVEAGEQ